MLTNCYSLRRLKRFICLLPLLLSACDNTPNEPIPQQQTISVRVPVGTTGNVYIASSLNDWNPADSNFKLSQTDSTTYSITMDPIDNKIEYKYTQGSWEQVERDSNGNDIANRELAPELGVPLMGSFADTIESWAQPTQPGSTRADNVYLIHENFAMPQLNSTRKIWVYLPQGYESGNKHYPVLYLQDGQNLFDAATSFAGEWAVDETLNELQDEQGHEFIAVGIENGGPERVNEYSAYAHPAHGGGQGELYVQFLTETLKPFIDENLRTLPGRENTLIGGSSLGGLISFYALLQQPEVFGSALVFSPSFWFSEQYFELARNTQLPTDTQVYFLAGGRESANMVNHTTQMHNILAEQGVEHLKLVVVPNGTHSESFWRKQFKPAMQWLQLGQEG